MAYSRLIASCPSWQKRRSEFNHDWLKNHFMPALAKWINILDGHVEDQDFGAGFMKITLVEWETHARQAVELVCGFEKEMSPRTMVIAPRFSKTTPATRRWLGNLVHELWLNRYPVQQWIDESVRCVHCADAAYLRIRRAFDQAVQIPSPLALREQRQLFIDFQDRCQTLAKSIEAYPSVVRVA